jgi:hypothetical protein
VEASQTFTQAQEIGDGEDPFATAAAPSDDPFAGGEFGDFEQPPADVPVAADLPVVDREGQPVPESTQQAVADAEAAVLEPAAVPGVPTLTPEQQAAEAAQYDAERTATPAAEPATPAPGPTPEAQAALDALKQPPPQVQEDPLARAERDAAMREEVHAASLAASGDPGAAALLQADAARLRADADKIDAERQDESQRVAPEPESEPEAPEPQETKDAKGKVTHRKYVVLKVTGPGKFEQVSWYEKDGKFCQKGTPGAARQTVCLARGTDDALRVGYAACGAPQDGVTLIAVAALYFQPRHVKPEPIVPSRMKLTIS